jgi:hypothetical protein
MHHATALLWMHLIIERLHNVFEHLLWADNERICRVLRSAGATQVPCARGIEVDDALDMAEQTEVCPEGGAEWVVPELVSALVRTTLLGECLMSPPDSQSGDNWHDATQRRVRFWP